MPLRYLHIRKRITITVMAVLSSASASSAAAQSAPPASAKTKIIIDTDIGDDLDDAFALGLALNSPEVDIVGITTAWGDTKLRARFPELKIIVIVRHPCNTIASQLLGRRMHKLPDKAPNPAIANSEQARRRGLSANEFAGMTLVDQLAYQWLIVYEKGIEELAGRSNCRIIRYEDLAASAESTANELFAFAHLPRSEATARFIERSQNSHWPSRYFGVLRPPSFHAKADRWRERLIPSEAQRILDIVGDSAPGRLYL